MALAAPTPVLLVMNSLTSGYVTLDKNGSDKWYGRWWKKIYMPATHVLMTSLHLCQRWGTVSLFLYTKTYNRSAGSFTQKLKKTEVWHSHQNECDFARLYYFNDTRFSILVSRKDFNGNIGKLPCFKLFFSFFPEGKEPQKLSSGVLNCSVEDYSSFQHHVTCNLKTECDDGRDETEHCPFSSADCQGQVALCDRCYNIVGSLRGFQEDKPYDNRRAEEYCNLLGGTLRFPKCVHKPYVVLNYKSKRYWGGLQPLWAGLNSNGLSVPTMYRHSVFSKEKIVFHHNFYVHAYNRDGEMCNGLADIQEMSVRLSNGFSDKLKVIAGAVCEIPTNSTKMKFDYSKEIPPANIELPLSGKQYSVRVWHNGYVAHKCLSRGLSQDKQCLQHFTYKHSISVQTSDFDVFNSTDDRGPVSPTFLCSSKVTMLSYTLVCDFTADCPDSSDEFFCKHPVCENSVFTCRNGECVPYENICDHMSHCQDESDERNCSIPYYEYIRRKRVPPPALINFDGISQFTAKPMTMNDSCPDSHYRCPSQFNDCLPIYTRCNGMYDCIEHQDEEECEERTCPGLLRCRLSHVCVHSDHVCDRWPHCPTHDDELWCGVACPVGCLCHGYTFVCPLPFNVEPFPQVRSLDASGSGMTPSDVVRHFYLIHLVLSRCSLRELPIMKLLNLKILDLSGNKLHRVNMTVFLGLENVQSLSLSNNPITALYADHSSAVPQTTLSSIDLSYTLLTVFDSHALATFSRLQTLNLSFTSIHAISPNGFQHIPHLTKLYIHNSPLRTFPSDIFKGLSHLRFISSLNYKLCCKDTLPRDFDASSCYAPRNEISSCEGLLQLWTYRGFLWLMTCLTLSGNIFCVCARLFAKSMTSSSGFSVFVTSLTMADFLMGVYLTIIGAADEQYRGQYLHYDDTWKNSVGCKVAGFLSLLSCEVSALIICLITLDRFVVICFPFSTLRFGKQSAAMVCLLVWLTGWFLALVPLLPVTSHWEFYSQTGICIPLPVTRQDFKGKVYSFSIMIVLNFVLFLYISVGQVLIYRSIQYNAFKTNSTKVSHDVIIARRLITIAVTDFMCWFPIGLCGILAQAGTAIPGYLNVALAIFILPLNSALNPFMYTLNTWVEKRNKIQEHNLLILLEAQAGITSDKERSSDID